MGMTPRSSCGQMRRLVVLQMPWICRLLLARHPSAPEVLYWNGCNTTHAQCLRTTHHQQLLPHGLRDDRLRDKACQSFMRKAICQPLCPGILTGLVLLLRAWLSLDCQFGPTRREPRQMCDTSATTPEPISNTRSFSQPCHHLQPSVNLKNRMFFPTCLSVSQCGYPQGEIDRFAMCPAFLPPCTTIFHA